jgi:hypothetical protein
VYELAAAVGGFEQHADDAKIPKNSWVLEVFNEYYDLIDNPHMVGRCFGKVQKQKKKLLVVKWLDNKTIDVEVCDTASMPAVGQTIYGPVITVADARYRLAITCRQYQRKGMMTDTVTEYLKPPTPKRKQKTNNNKKKRRRLLVTAPKKTAPPYVHETPPDDEGDAAVVAGDAAGEGDAAVVAGDAAGEGDTAGEADAAVLASDAAGEADAAVLTSDAAGEGDAGDGDKPPIVDNKAYVLHLQKQTQAADMRTNPDKWRRLYKDKVYEQAREVQTLANALYLQAIGLDKDKDKVIPPSATKPATPPNDGDPSGDYSPSTLFDSR